MVLFYLVTSLYLVNCQIITDILKIKPEKCYGDDNLMDRRCCIFPPFFKRDVARSCGGLFALVEINNEHNVTNLRRDNKNCDYWKCLLQKYSMLDPGNKLNIENYFTHLERWTTLNPDFTAAVSNAKMHCHEEFRLYFPLTTCEFFEFQKCIRGFVNVHCPVVVQSKECMEWKEFFEECNEFFI